MINPCTLTTVWDDGVSISTAAQYDPETKEVESLETVDAGDLEILKREFITLPDGTELDVCRQCHEHTTEIQMVEGTGKHLHEVPICPVCDKE